MLPGRTADTIVSWLEKKTGPAAKTLATVDEAKAFVADNDIAIIGFFDSVDSDGNIGIYKFNAKLLFVFFLPQAVLKQENVAK